MYEYGKVTCIMLSYEQEFDSTYPINLQGVMAPDEFVRHISSLDVVLVHGQKRTKRTAIFMFLVIMIFVIFFPLTTAMLNEYLGLIITLPIVYAICLTACIVSFIRGTIRLRQELQSEIECINRETVPRGIQWSIHSAYKSFWVSFKAIILSLVF
jgi:hypothetical protein